MERLNKEITTMNFRKFIENTEIYLWLDDLRPMPNNFNQHAKTAKEAIDILKTNNVAKISLDHDLGPPEAGTGYDVAKFIEEQAFHQNIKPMRWEIHSANVIGRQNIEMAMTNADKFWSRYG